MNLSLIVLASCLICELHPVQINPLAQEQALGVAYRLSRQEAGAAQDPGVFNASDAQDFCAGVHYSHAGVVCGEDPVRTVGGN